MSLERQLEDYGRIHEDLFGPIDVDEITDPLVDERKMGTSVAETPPPKRTNRLRRPAGPIWAGVAFVAVLAVAALYLLLSDIGKPAVDEPVPSSTTIPEVETLTDLEVIQAGVAALYSGDGARAVELFDLEEFTDEQIRSKAAYEAAIGSKVTLNCREMNDPGVFNCAIAYTNALSNATGSVDSPDISTVVVGDGVIREFSFPDQRAYMASIGDYFLDIDPACAHEFFSLFPEEPLMSPTAQCVNVVLDHLDEWAAFERSR